MAIPFAATGYGNGSDAQNVFGVYVTVANLSSAIKYECYDNDQTFPATDSVLTVANTVLAGTTKNGSKSMIALVDTTNAAPDEIWVPYAASAGEANPNLMKGQTSYVEQDGSTLTTTDRATFNMAALIPSDMETTDAAGFDLLVRYTYTGSAPTLTFQANEGTEGSPTWTSLTVDTHGIKHCRTADTYANIPADDAVCTAVSQCSGLDDLTSGGAHSAASCSYIEVEIDGTGTPDTFKWRKNGGSYTEDVSITGSAQTLSDGVTVTFGATTGHTLADNWAFWGGAEWTTRGYVTT